MCGQSCVWFLGSQLTCDLVIHPVVMAFLQASSYLLEWAKVWQMPRFGRRMWLNVRLGLAWQCHKRKASNDTEWLPKFGGIVIRPNFSNNPASFVVLPLQRFALATGINLKSLYLLLVTRLVSYQLTSRPTTDMQYTTN